MPDVDTLLAARVRERLAGLDLDAATEAETIEELTQHVEDRYRDLLAARNRRKRPPTRERGASSRDTPDSRARSLPCASLRESPPLQDTGRNGLGAWWDDARFAWRRSVPLAGFALVALLTVR